MDKELYNFRSSVVETLVELRKDGNWQVTIGLKQKRKRKPLDEWEVKEMNITQFGKEMERVLAEVSVTISTYLESLQGDLFNEDIPRSELIS